jgi:hypothetical protein
MLLLSPRHEQFAQCVAGGASAAQAYRDTYPNASTATAETHGPELLRRSQVAVRVDELRGIQRTVVTEEFKVSREDMVRYLHEVLITPVGEIDADHVLAQEMTRSRRVRGRGEDGEEWETEKIKMPAKMDATEKLIKLAGWYAPETRRIEGMDQMLELMTAIRAGA